METASLHSKHPLQYHEEKLVRNLWENGLVHMNTVVDTVHDPFLILDEHLRVVAASTAFYRTFHLKHSHVEWRALHELGEGEWATPALVKLLRTIVSRNTFFKGFHLTHIFPRVGWKAFLVSGRRLYVQSDELQEFLSPLLLLAFEDITDMMHVAEQLGNRIALKRKRSKTT